MENNIRVVILAAGKGTRMKSELPKALMPLKGKPMIQHVLDAVAASGIDARPVIVVGYGKEKLIPELGDRYDYVVQDEQLGTGHALMAAQASLEHRADHILVLPSDHPGISVDTIRKLAEKHMASGATITMATIHLPDFKDWRNFFYTNFSRIIRNSEGEIIKSVEVRDTSEAEKKITEVNPIFMCFDAQWLWKNIKNIKPDNVQKEYYMTDLIHIAIEHGMKIASIDINPEEGLAANSREELDILEKFAPKV